MRHGLGGRGNPAQAVFVDRQRQLLARRAPLDLDEGDRPPAPGDQVDLAARAFHPPRNDPPAVQAQPPTGPALAPPVPLSSGGVDLYIQQEKFHTQFAADVPKADAKLMAAGQRPIAEAALGEAAGDPAWKKIPSWFVYGDKDKNIPPAASAFMAERAQAKKKVVIKGASHVVMVSHPEAVARLIERASVTK